MSTTSQADLASPARCRVALDALLWPALLVAASLVGSGAFACATPFAAFAAIAAATMPTRAALMTVAAIWTTNQAVGFLALGYPWTLDAAIWGVALGAAALLATAAATPVLRRPWTGRASIGIPAAFVAAFAAYEAVLLATALMLGGVENFAPAIIAQVLEIAVAWLAGLWVTHALLQRSGLGRIPCRSAAMGGERTYSRGARIADWGPTATRAPRPD
jgi:hypothetical protein